MDSILILEKPYGDGQKKVEWILDILSHCTRGKTVIGKLHLTHSFPFIPIYYHYYYYYYYYYYYHYYYYYYYYYYYHSYFAIVEILFNFVEFSIELTSLNLQMDYMTFLYDLRIAIHFVLSWHPIHLGTNLIRNVAAKTFKLLPGFCWCFWKKDKEKLKSKKCPCWLLRHVSQFGRKSIASLFSWLIFLHTYWLLLISLAFKLLCSELCCFHYTGWFVTPFRNKPLLVEIAFWSKPAKISVSI